MGLFSIVKSCKHENVNFANLGKNIYYWRNLKFSWVMLFYSEYPYKFWCL